MVEDLTLEALEARARLEAELFRERAPPILVRAQRLRLAARAIESEHELPARALPERLVGHERLQLDDEFVVAPEVEARLDALLLGREPQLLEAGDLGLREVLVPELGERRAAPEGESLS